MYKNPQKFTISIRSVRSMGDSLEDASLPEFFVRELVESFDYNYHKWEYLRTESPKMTEFFEKILEKVENFMMENGDQAPDDWGELLPENDEDSPFVWYDEDVEDDGDEGIEY